MGVENLKGMSQVQTRLEALTLQMQNIAKGKQVRKNV